MLSIYSHYTRFVAIAIAITLTACANKEEESHQHPTTSSVSETSDASQITLNEAQFEASEIKLGAVSLKNLSAVVNANGYTKLPPQNQADVSVFVSGIVKSISVIEGQMVKKGQIIATIESPEFTRIQQEYLTSKSQLEFLKLEYERQRILSEEEVSARKVFQKTKAEYDIEKARFASLKKQLETMHINPNAGAVSTVPVVAPISGAITEVNMTIGSNVSPGTTLVTLVDNSQLHVDLLVYEKDLQKVKPGQNVRFVLTNQDQKEISGSIFSVGKAFENETKSVAVHADIDNVKHQLIPGMYVNALIDIGHQQVPALPSDAVVKSEGKEFVFVLDRTTEETLNNTDNKPIKQKLYTFKRIEVKTGVAQLGYVQVTFLEEPKDANQIVLSGAYYIQSHWAKSQDGGEHEH